MLCKQRIESMIVVLFIAIMPVMMLTKIGHSSGAFLGLTLLCLFLCFSRAGGVTQTWKDFTPYRSLAIALSISLLTVLASSIWQHKYLASDAERALRTFLGSLVILAACLSLMPHILRQAAWGMTAATWAAAGYSIWLSWPTFVRPDVPEYNAVSYGNLLLLMAVLSTFSISWKLTSYRKSEIAFKLLTAFIGLIGFLFTQTRSGWVAVPFFIVIGLVLLHGKFSLRKIMLPTLIACTLASALFASSTTMRARAKAAVTEVIECRNNPIAITSVCIRLQLWRASIKMFKANPLIGNGSTQAFPAALKVLADQGVVSKFTVTDVFDEPHNDMMFALASYGVLGLLGLLLLYFAPAWIFAKRLAAKVPHEARVAAAMGLAVCIGFFAFGLTELMFRGMRTMGFYATMLGWLLALSDEKLISK
jgi:O-antigen ligase